MGRELTRRHSSLFETKVTSLLLFARDIYKYGKVRELASFIVWELFHKLCLFRPSQYLQFDASQPLRLEPESLNPLALSAQLDQCFSSRGLRLISSRHNWKLLFINNSNEILGCLYPDDRALYKSLDSGKSVILLKRFPEAIKGIFISSQKTLFVCVRGAVYKSSDSSDFRKVLDFASPESFFRHNNGMTETPAQTLIIGEYGNVWDKSGWRKLAYLYFSSDNGETWKRSDFLIQQGANKHVHLVRYCKSVNRIFVADGDNTKKLWISDTLTAASDPQRPINWKAVNKFHIQMGGYTSIVESDQEIILGTDYQGGTNFIVATRDARSFQKSIVPDPYRRSPIDNMVQRRSKRGNEIWANLPYSTANSRCLLMYSGNGGRTWNKIIEYSRARHKVWLVSSATEIADELYLSIETLGSKDRAVYRITDA